MSMPAETGLQIYNSFRKLQKNGKKNEKFGQAVNILRIIYYFYGTETMFPPSEKEAPQTLKPLTTTDYGIINRTPRPAGSRCGKEC